MRTAIIHIGAPKTGSTAIQAALSDARATLEADGFHYLSGDRNHGERLALAFWDKADALRLAGLRWHDGEAALLHREAVQAAFAEEIDRATSKTVILSAEDLSTFRRSEVQRLHVFLSKRFDRIRVIAYLREPLDWATSAAQQATKWSGDVLNDLFDRPRLPDYAGRFGPWIDVYGRESVEFRIYPKNILTDFSETIGLAACPGTHSRLNEAISHRAAILLSHINALRPPFVEARHNPLRSFDVIRDARLPGRRFTLPEETVTTWCDAFAAERDWANTALGASVFSAPEPPTLSRTAWFGGEREALEDFAAALLEKSRLAQNERSLRLLIKARKHRDDPDIGEKLLDQAWLLCTDRWTLDLIAMDALDQNRTDREKFFAKSRLMRRIEAPEPGDIPLIVGNPYDRPWHRRDAPTLPESAVA